MTNKRLISIIAILSLAVSCFAGCGEAVTEEEEVIELVEPVGVGARSVPVSKRDMVTFDTFPAIVSPVITEYSFNTAQTFEYFGKIPGSKVNKGDVLIYGSTEDLDKKIKAQKETIENLDKGYTEYLEDNSDKLPKAKADFDYYTEIVERLEDQKPSEYLDGAANPAFKDWQGQYSKFDIMMRNASLSVDRITEERKEKDELYVLDRAYNVSNLNRLTSTRSNALLSSKTSGEMVAVGFYDPGAYMGKDISVAAVGDMNNLEIVSDFVSKSYITHAKDYYALINGKRVEIQYNEVDNEEYTRLKNVNGEVFSHFTITSDATALNPGDYAVIVIISGKSEDAIAIPKDALHTDENGYLVYVYENETFVDRRVKVGLRSGEYIEIKEGLSEGELVMSDEYIEPAKSTVKLEKGSAAGTFKADGFLYYPSTEWIDTDIEYGTVYLTEYLVKKYERVEKGQTIATINVLADDIEIARLERQILRENDTLTELKKDNTDDKNKRAIANREESIKNLNEKLSDMKKDKATVKVVAPFSGVITDIANYKDGDIIPKDKWIVQLADDTESFIVIEDTGSQTAYGQTAAISYKGKDGSTRECTGKVVTAFPDALNKDLKQGYALISVPPENLADMAGSSPSNEGWWNRNRFTIEIAVRSVENVVVIPKKAVVLLNGAYYVKVKDENGNMQYKEFISGGSDVDNYWVIDGLSEGEEICLD